MSSTKSLYGAALAGIGLMLAQPALAQSASPDIRPVQNVPDAGYSAILLVAGLAILSGIAWLDRTRAGKKS